MAESDLKFYHAVQRGMRAQAKCATAGLSAGGAASSASALADKPPVARQQALTALVKRWRYTQSSDFAAIELKPAAARFLIRYGALDAGDDAAARLKTFRELLTRVARASGDAPGVVAAWLNLFAAGAYGVAAQGLCGDAPNCAACTLQESCRYLAAGAKDARAFGASLATELLSAQRVDEFSGAQLLAFLLAPEKFGAAEIHRAEAALKECGGLRGFLQAPQSKFRELKFPPAAISRAQALGELCRHWAGETLPRGKTFARGQDFFDYYHLRLRDLKKEVFIVVILDQKNALLGDEQVSEGSLTETLVHPREVFATALASRAAAVALIHNHPSGDPTPSAADKAITKRLAGVAKMLGIRLLDHVVVGDGKFASFVEEGLLE